jgi:hypothetical protein
MFFPQNNAPECQNLVVEFKLLHTPKQNFNSKQVFCQVTKSYQKFKINNCLVAKTFGKKF